MWENTIVWFPEKHLFCKPGTKPTLQADSLPSEPPGKPFQLKSINNSPFQIELDGLQSSAFNTDT